MVNKFALLLVGSTLSFSALALISPNADCNDDAKTIILFWDNIESQTATIKNAPKQLRIPLTVKLSQAQRIRQWNKLRSKLKQKISVVVKSDIKIAAKNEDMSERGFLSGVYGAKYFRAELEATNVEKLTRAEALLKTLILETISDKLKDHSNFDLTRWGLSPEETRALLEKIETIQNKIGM
jgi:hypothetical protein